MQSSSTAALLAASGCTPILQPPDGRLRVLHPVAADGAAGVRAAPSHAPRVVRAGRVRDLVDELSDDVRAVQPDRDPGLLARPADRGAVDVVAGDDGRRADRPG